MNGVGIQMIAWADEWLVCFGAVTFLFGSATVLVVAEALFWVVGKFFFCLLRVIWRCAAACFVIIEAGLTGLRCSVLAVFWGIFLVGFLVLCLLQSSNWHWFFFGAFRIYITHFFEYSVYARLCTACAKFEVLIKIAV